MKSHQKDVSVQKELTYSTTIYLIKNELNDFLKISGLKDKVDATVELRFVGICIRTDMGNVYVVYNKGCQFEAISVGEMRG